MAGLSPREVVEFGPDGRAVVAKLSLVADPVGDRIEVIQRGGRFR